MYNRRAFLTRSAQMVGGLTLVSAAPILAACGDDDDEPSGTASGTVGTAFNWVPDIEWSAWYLAEENGHFGDRGVTSELIHGGPNTPSVVQTLAAGEGHVGLSSTELGIIIANREGADFVVLGAMYQRNPLGLTWLAETPISSPEDLVGLRIGATQGEQPQIDAAFIQAGLEPEYEFVPMSFDPQPLADGEVDVMTSYVTNQPIRFELQGVATESATWSDFGLPSYGDTLFVSRAWLDENRDLAVAYLAGLLEGVNDNRADPSAVIPIITERYSADFDIDEEYFAAANPAYIALMDSDYTDENGLLSIDPDRLENEVWAGLEAAGETDLPSVDDYLDGSVLEDAHAAIG